MIPLRQRQIHLDSSIDSCEDDVEVLEVDASDETRMQVETEVLTEGLEGFGESNFVGEDVLDAG